MGERSRRHDVGPVVQGLFVFAVLVWALVFLGSGPATCTRGATEPRRTERRPASAGRGRCARQLDAGSASGARSTISLDAESIPGKLTSGPRATT